MNDIQAIVFDLDGTVIDTEPLWNQANAELLQRRGLIYNEAVMQPLIMGKHVVEGNKVEDLHAKGLLA